MTIDWSAVQEHLDHLGLDPEEAPIYFTAWEKGWGTHFKKNGSPIAGDVEALFKQRPNLSLGIIVNPGGTKKADITQAVALFTEDDSGASIEEQMVSWQPAGLPEPGLSVFTGNKSVHHYWPLQESITPDEFTVLQRRLQAVMQAANPGGDADASLEDSCQVMRVAGASHPKTGKQAEITRATGERFSVQELTEAFSAAEAHFNITPSTTSAPDRRNKLATAPAGNGTHYKDLTAAQRHGVVIDALKHCPDRGLEGGGGYPKAQRILAALVHEFGSEVACDLAAQADWSQDSDWDIAKVAASLEADPPEAGKRSKIWTVFTIAAEEPANPDDPWLCPWKEAPAQPQPALTPTTICTLDADDLVPADQSLLSYWGDGWTENDKGQTIPTRLNAGSALTHLRSALPSSAIRLNIVTGLVEINGSSFEEADLETFYAEVQAQGWGINKEAVKDAVVRLSIQNRYDPIQEYLNHVAVAPDIEPVDINQISTTYLGTTDPDFDLYLKIALLGAVKRRFEPGCQFDTVVTLDGDGRIGKSAFWICLASPDWHTSSDAESEKDFLLILHQAWIYEQAELDYLTSKKAVGQLKNLITTRKDTVRAPYGKGMENRNRQGIMVGTVNGAFLQGDEALRGRFLVIQCPQSFQRGERIDFERLAADRNRIWKAAVLAYRNGEQAFLNPQQLAAASNRNLEGSEQEHIWLESISKWLDQPINANGPHTTDDILIGARLRTPEKLSRTDQQEVSRCMGQIGGWIKDKTPQRHGGRKSRFWRKVESFDW